MSCISTSTWIWAEDSKPVTVEVRKLATFYGVKLTIEHSSVDLTMDRKDLVNLRDKISNCLLDG